MNLRGRYGYRLPILLAGLLLAASLQAQPGQPARSWPIADAPEALRPLVEQADLIVVELQGALLGELSRALAQGGPESAVQSCHIDVIGAARRVAGRRTGIDAGRTSHRLRNPVNEARGWAASFVEADAGRPARDVDGYVVDLGNRIGVLRPIAQQPLCGSCHGPADRLAPAVRDVLALRYPGDRATGFEPGDIRGWYWVELAVQGP
jgi:signal transduction histidine kinase